MPPTPAKSNPPPPRSPWLVRLLRLAILCFLGLTLMTGALLFLLLLLQLAMQDRIVPGTSIGEVDIGGMPRADASAALAQSFEPLGSQQYTLRDGEQSWSFSAAELGLSMPVTDLVDGALAVGYAADGSPDFYQQARAWLRGAQLPLRLQFDESVALARLQALAQSIQRERRDAQLQIDGMRVSIDPGLPGRSLNLPASLATLSQRLLAQDAPRSIDLIIDESPARQWNIHQAARQVQTALSSPLQLLGDMPDGDKLQPWLLRPEQILAGLHVHMTGDDSQRRYTVAVDLSAYAPFLRTLSPRLSQPARETRFDFDPINGRLTALAPPQTGRSLNVPETIARLEAAVFAPTERRVAMAFDEIAPRYPATISSEALGIQELVAEATTYFWGSWQNRRSNIALGTKNLHGIIVAPGEEFSFNQHLGEITAEAGYVEGGVILGGATVTGIGGGICQVSTTLFRAVYKGGLDITERNSHGYRVGYYEYAGAGPGLDAAIWQPEIDLRFRNNTPHHLLIESDYLGEKDAMQFRIYSTRHWTTRIEPAIIRDIVPAPDTGYVAADDLALGQIRQIDYSADGADVWVYRNVYDAAGSLVKRDQLFTHYKPWQAIYEVAPGDPRLIENEEAAEESDRAPVGVDGT